MEDTDTALFCIVAMTDFRSSVSGTPSSKFAMIENLTATHTRRQGLEVGLRPGGHRGV